MAEETVKAGSVLWRRGDIVKDVILIGEGSFCFKELPQTESEPFQAGALLVDVYSLEHRKPHRLTFAKLRREQLVEVLSWFGFDGEALGALARHLKAQLKQARAGTRAG